jgi:hypothetical protein
MANYDGKAPHRVSNTSYDTKYPYNQATIYEAGHEVHFDNTPGKERIRLSHKSGSHIEFAPDGKITMFAVGNHQQYHKAGMSLTVDENGDIKIHGHNRQNTNGGNHKTARGDSDKVTGGHSTIVVGGNAKIAVAGDAYTGVKGNQNINVGGNLSMKIAGDTTMETKGTHTIVAAKITMNP